MSDNEVLLDADEVARRIGCTRRHVERLNAEGDGPPSVRVGRRLRRYPERLFEEWIKSLHGKVARSASGEQGDVALLKAPGGAIPMPDCCSGYPNCIHNMPQRMTDLERAAWAALKGDIPTWPAQIVAMLAAERERCARIAERLNPRPKLDHGDYQNGWDRAATEIAAAIRRGDEPSGDRQLSLRETVDKLRAVKGSGWKDIDDPLAELRRLRGNDSEE